MVELATHVGYYKQGEQENKIQDVSPWRLPPLGFKHLLFSQLDSNPLNDPQGCALSLIFNLVGLRLSDFSLGCSWACLDELHKKVPTSVEWSRLGEIRLIRARFFGSIWLGQVWVSAGAFQLSLFSFVYSAFPLSSPFFPRTLKLIQIWE